MGAPVSGIYQYDGADVVDAAGLHVLLNLLGDSVRSSLSAAWTPVTPAANWRAYLGDALYLPAYRLTGSLIEIRPGMLQRTGANATTVAGTPVPLIAALPPTVRPTVTAHRSAGSINLTSATPTLASFYVDPADGILKAIPSTAGTLTADGSSSYVSVPHLVLARA